MEANKAVMGKMNTVFYKVLVLTMDHSILTQELAAKSEALKNSADLMKAADETMKEFQLIVAEQKDEIERLLVAIDNFSEHSQVVSNSMKTVSTASQASVNIPDYNANSLWPAEAADKISRLEDELYKKRKCVTKLKNKLTRYRLRGNRIRRKPQPKTDYTQRHSEQLDL
jgi:predicted O-linked N-acetylglucosamine transferase (SPINDLY family)